MPPWSRALARGRHRDAGQAQLRRVRDGLGQRELGLRPGAQPVGPDAHARRLLGRHRRRRGRAPAAGRHRHRHRRLDPPAGRFSRRHRHQADLRRVLALRHDRLRLQPGPGRPDGAPRRGLRAAAVGHVRPRPTATRPRSTRPPRTSRADAARAKAPRDATVERPAHRPAEGVLRRRPGRRRARRRATPRWRKYEKLGATLVDISLPRTELSIPVYYIIAPAEASSNLSPLRRREVRPPRRRSTPTCSTCTRRPAPKVSATRSSAAS